MVLTVLLGVLAAMLGIETQSMALSASDNPTTFPSPSGDPTSLKPTSDPPQRRTPAPSPQSPPNQATPTLPASVQAAAERRARHVYQLPDGSIWDSYQYVQLRTVLAEFDGLKEGARPAGRVAAWGFKSGKRSVATKEKRPHPLWVSLQPQKTNDYTPFIYVNSSLLSPREKKADAYFKLGKQRRANVYEFTFHEYPGDQSALVGLPVSIWLGYATGVVELPSGLSAAPDTSLSGEFVLVPLGTPPPSAGGLPENPTHKLYHANTFRMTVEMYCRALAQGQAELVDWTFQRQTSSFGDTYTWTRNVIFRTPAKPSTP
jgi:hypothetical protein